MWSFSPPGDWVYTQIRLQVIERLKQGKRIATGPRNMDLSEQMRISIEEKRDLGRPTYAVGREAAEKSH